MNYELSSAAARLLQAAKIPAYTLLNTILRRHENAVAVALAEAELPDMSAAEFHALAALYRAGKSLRASELAAAAGRAATAFTPILDGLERRGLVERRANAVDRRSVMICTTEQAEAMRTVFMRLADDLNVQLWQDISGL